MHIILFYEKPNFRDPCNYFEKKSDENVHPGLGNMLHRDIEPIHYQWTSSIERAKIFHTKEAADEMVSVLLLHYNGNTSAGGIHSEDVTDQRGNIMGKKFGI